jgi:hypothetical protein
MRRAAWLSVISMACSSPPTTSHVEESSPPAVFGEHTVDQKTHRIEPGECPARIADEPVPYFGGEVLLRLPADMSALDFVEFTPGVLVLSTGPIESSHCREGMPDAVIRFAALVELRERPLPDRPLASIRDQTLRALGYPDESTIVEQDPEATLWVFEVAVDRSVGRSEPAKILITTRVTYDGTFLLVFEVSADDWPVLVDSLVASARDLTVLSP